LRLLPSKTLRSLRCAHRNTLTGTCDRRRCAHRNTLAGTRDKLIGGLAENALHFDVLVKTTIVVMHANPPDVGLQPQKFFYLSLNPSPKGKGLFKSPQYFVCLGARYFCFQLSV
jgi:hypothetical protein